MPTTDKRLVALLESANEGSLVLPEFQREYVWKVSDIRAFVGSLMLDYPVGSFLTVEESPDLFAHKPLLGLGFEEQESPQPSTVTYLLDGQQRLTSCHLVFGEQYRNKEVPDSVRRRWFLDLNKLGLADLAPLTDEDLTQAFEEDPGALIVKKIDLRATTRPEFKDFSSEDFRAWCLQYNVYPFSYELLKGSLHNVLLMNVAEKRLTELATNLNVEQSSQDYRKLELQKDEWVNWVSNLLRSLSTRSIPALQIEPGATLEKVARVFETVNKTGMNLSLFDLLVARATSLDHPSLRKVIDEARQEFDRNFSESVLGGESTGWSTDAIFDGPNGNVFFAEYPKVLAAIIKLGRGENLELSKKAILKTPREWVNTHAAAASNLLLRAFAFMQIRGGVPWQYSGSPYQAMILPLACALEDDSWFSKDKLGNVEAWYWAAIFGKRYAEAQDQRAREDVITLRAYVAEGGSKPEIISSLFSHFVELNSLRDTSSGDGLYRGVLQFVLSRKPFDLRNGSHRLSSSQPFTAGVNGRLKKYEDHHIVPAAWVRKNRANLPSAEYVDSCLNRAYISFEANRGADEGVMDQNPTQYLSHLSPRKEILDSLMIPEQLLEEYNDPLECILQHRYNLFKNAVLHHVTQLA